MEQFNQTESQFVNEMNRTNNEYIQLRKQLQEEEFKLKRISEEIHDIKSGKTRFPLMVAMGTNLFKPVPAAEKKDIIKF